MLSERGCEELRYFGSRLPPSTWLEEGGDDTALSTGEKQQSFQAHGPFDILAKAPNRPATAHNRLTSMGKTMLWRRIHHRLCG